MTESEVKSPTVMSVSLKYGVISAAIGIVLFIVRAIMSGNPFDRSWAWTLINIAAGIIIIVLAHREFKNLGNGFMSFGEGFKIAFMTTLISFLISGVFTFLYITFIDTELMNNFYLSQREQMETQGMSDSQIDTAIEWTQKLFWPFFLIGGVFSAALMGVVIPIFTQKRNPEPGF